MNDWKVSGLAYGLSYGKRESGQGASILSPNVSNPTRVFLISKRSQRLCQFLEPTLPSVIDTTQCIYIYKQLMPR